MPPESEISPSTLSLCSGALLLIPTLPEESMRMRSAAAVYSCIIPPDPASWPIWRIELSRMEYILPLSVLPTSTSRPTEALSGFSNLNSPPSPAVARSVISPLTSNIVPGVFVPIPTLPLATKNEAVPTVNVLVEDAFENAEVFASSVAI